MNKRSLGNTGIKVSEIGFGAMQLGNESWSDMTDSQASYLVDHALELGCNFFDTSPSYAGGHSEELLGEALKGKRNQAVICTKYGHSPTYVTNFSAENIKVSLEGSLKRLQTDYLDVILLHNPPFALLDGSSPQYEVFEQLKKEGKIRAYGASLDSSSDMKKFIESTKGQVLEVLFNVFYQETLGAFKLAAQRGVGLIAKVPLDSGWLSGKYNAASRFTGDRERWSESIIQRRGELVEKVRFMVSEGTTMAQAALQYILAQPEMSTVITGIKDVAHLEHNIYASDNKMPEKTVREIFEFWKRELKENPIPW